MATILQDGFIVTNATPIDSRSVVLTVDDRNAIPSHFRFLGLPAYVISENKSYRLVGGIDNTNWQGESSSYALTASYVSGSLGLSASYSDTASYAIYAETASYVEGTASYALTASYVSGSSGLSDTASYAIYSDTASYSETAGTAFTADFAILAGDSITSTYASTSFSSDFAVLAGDSITSTYASTSLVSNTASYALTSSYVNSILLKEDIIQTLIDEIIILKTRIETIESKISIP